MFMLKKTNFPIEKCVVADRNQLINIIKMDYFIPFSYPVEREKERKGNPSPDKCGSAHKKLGKRFVL